MTINAIHSTAALPSWTILCDFDGTISFKDVTDTLLDAFGMSGWQHLEQQWEAGDIGSRECMAGQIALLDASRRELNECLSSLTIDPGFAEFAAYAHKRKVPLHIVSDGLDYAINFILQANGLSGIPVIANSLRQVSERRWALDFPYHNPQCLKGSGVCKCGVAKAVAVNKILMIGDGRSDFCVSQVADHVFAKKSLVDECRRMGVPFSAFRDFSTLPALLDGLLEQRERVYLAPVEQLIIRGMCDQPS
ncbi:MtnX-like HAD-IB family phosphatase [Acerihabitans sp. TG2]|uniref:MtnX-like HAD-IB family phosphatase n=1 Tax=Acerihabitans sp. TG2 TaxID=3096008 RepID=UPI002B223C50|nr:MtnX-like HAD-IB family phosphatase [Acerihabitans sp. TG2]MEA9389669.1 MtnX-like HAD-IB family phosphatase [Acerihabitans sp. TG2]